jgi:hypothetical protein
MGNDRKQMYSAVKNSPGNGKHLISIQTGNRYAPGLQNNRQDIRMHLVSIKTKWKQVKHLVTRMIGRINICAW